MAERSSVVDWMFRSRQDGRITVGQFPNTAMWVFVAATVTCWVLPDPSTVHTAVRVVATLALTWWAADELVRGCNPFRRALGAGALVWVLTGLLGVR
jgi:hypothetical protein